MEVLKNRIIHGDALEVLGRLPDGSIDLVLTDPPYFRIAAEKWDRKNGTVLSDYKGTQAALAVRGDSKNELISGYKRKKPKSGTQAN